MRKTFSLILSAIMILSLFTVGAFAAEGTAINSAEDFKNMAVDGTYYLAADITVSETYTETFTGTLDGNGKTVTVSAPMFKQMNGTVKNLTTTGKIEINSTEYVSAGAVACESKGGIFENITNKATITVVGADNSKVGGIVGRLNGSTPAAKLTGCVNEADITSSGAVGGIAGCCYCTDTVFENCVNKGKIVNTNGSKDGYAAGGIYGYNGTGAVVVKNCYNAGDIVSPNRAGGIVGDARKSATIEFCTNDGNVTLNNTTKINEDTVAGGIVGSAYDSGATVPLTIKNCLNNGDVSAYVAGNATGIAGGILGNAANNTKKDTNAGNPCTVENCINNGKVSGGFEAGGLIGYVFGSNKECAIITNSINNGDVASACWASEFIGYTNHDGTTVKNVIGAGKLSALTVEGKTARLSIVNLSSAVVENYTFENVFVADGGTTVNFSFGNGDSNVKNNIPFSAVDGKDLSGAVVNYEGNDRTIGDSNVKAITRGELNAELITKANTAVGSELFALKDGNAAFASVKIGSSLKSGTNPGGGSSTPTGDTAAYVAVAAVAAVVILGTALVSKKRVTD